MSKRSHSNSNDAPDTKRQKETEIEVKIINPDASVPVMKTEGAAGYDLTTPQSVVVSPGTWTRIDLGFSMAIPQGYYAEIKNRSGLADQLNVFNGTIDSDYRGPIIVLATSFNSNSVALGKGTRIAQMIIKKCKKFPIKVVSELEPTARGEGGFGSTGLIDKE